MNEHFGVERTNFLFVDQFIFQKNMKKKGIEHALIEYRAIWKCLFNLAPASIYYEVSGFHAEKISLENTISFILIELRAQGFVTGVYLRGEFTWAEMKVINRVLLSAHYLYYQTALSEKNTITITEKLESCIALLPLE
ncbi:hypothetical protein ACJX0J_026248, partial [Zea mays]